MERYFFWLAVKQKQNNFQIKFHTTDLLTMWHDAFDRNVLIRSLFLSFEVLWFICVIFFSYSVWRHWPVVPQTCWPSVFSGPQGSLGWTWRWAVLSGLESPSAMVDLMPPSSLSRRAWCAWCRAEWWAWPGRNNVQEPSEQNKTSTCSPVLPTTQRDKISDLLFGC